MVNHSLPTVEVMGLTKTFGALTALEDVSVRFAPGSFHALLGENGAGKSTLAKCIMGYHQADSGEISVEGQPRRITNPQQAHRLGLGMVYQNFTLVPNMTVAENLILGEERMPWIIDWQAQTAKLEEFFGSMPFRLDLNKMVKGLAAGEKQKLEILKQLFLGHWFLILDEPTSVLTPSEADEILGLMRQMVDGGRITVVLITHKLREVEEFASEITVLRSGRVTGRGRPADVNRSDLIRMMIGRETVPSPVPRTGDIEHTLTLEIRNLTINNHRGVTAVKSVNLNVGTGEIVGVAGVSGNGQTELVEVLAGQRQEVSGRVLVAGNPYQRTRADIRREQVFLLSEEPLRNSCVPSMTVSENLALRNFDEPKNTRWRWFIHRQSIAKQAQGLIERFSIKTQGPDAQIKTLSGGNVQRTVLARELSEEVSLLIAQNPCSGLDLNAVAEIRNKIVEVRNAGAAVLLISEDLDEILALSDRIVVMFEGQFVYETTRDEADVQTIGRYMASRE